MFLFVFFLTSVGCQQQVASRKKNVPPKEVDITVSEPDFIVPEFTLGREHFMNVYTELSPKSFGAEDYHFVANFSYDPEGQEKFREDSGLLLVQHSYFTNRRKRVNWHALSSKIVDGKKVWKISLKLRFRNYYILYLSFPRNGGEGNAKTLKEEQAIHPVFKMITIDLR